MEYKFIEKSRIPACTFDEQLFIKLWQTFSQDGEFLWHAVVGTGGDLLGRQEQRPTQRVESWQDLAQLARSLPRIDQLTLTLEVEHKGTVAIAFKNFVPVGGTIIVSGWQQEWVQARFDACTALFNERKKSFTTFIYTWLGFGMIQTVIPLSSMFVLVMAVAGLVIPSHIRHSEWIWWITAATIVITLRLAYTVSDRLIIYVMTKYPYIK